MCRVPCLICSPYPQVTVLKDALDIAMDYLERTSQAFPLSQTERSPPGVVNIIEFNAGGCGLLDNLLEGKNMGGDPVRVGSTCGNDEDLTSFRLELYLTGISTMRRLTSPARSAGNSRPGACGRARGPARCLGRIG
jgi:hypothetical protein